MKKLIPTRKKNVPLETWVLKPKNYQKEGIFTVLIGTKYVPITNQLCPKCHEGWNDPFKFAVMENIVYHRHCLERWLGTKEFKKLLASEKIITE